MQPNIIFMMSDDHAAHAMSCYHADGGRAGNLAARGGRPINRTPNLDRIAQGGMRFDHCFCTNSICTPSRAAILAGTYNHVNGVTTLATPMDNRLPTYPKRLQDAGYQTAIFGKWHLGVGPDHCPTGFDDWAVLPGQGLYHDPEFIFKGPGGGERRTLEGYVTDLITDLSLEWLDARDPERPFCLMVHHKAPHRPWEPDARHAALFEDETIPEPDTLYDDYEHRARAAAVAAMRVGEHMTETDVKRPIPDDLKGHALRKWAYQHYMKDYLRVVASVDDNVGRLLDYLDERDLARDTIVIYTSDQGFFLGDHGWYDKRFMYEESLRMPFVIRYPREIEAGSVCNDIILNVDFAPTFLDFAGVTPPDAFQGRSFRALLNGTTPSDWQTAMYYRYWMNTAHHNVAAHYGIRTRRFKLIYYYADGLGQAGTEAPPRQADDDRVSISAAELEPEWELFDLENDPFELNNLYGDPGFDEVVDRLTDELHRLQAAVGDQPYKR